MGALYMGASQQLSRNETTKAFAQKYVADILVIKGYYLSDSAQANCWRYVCVF
jgi:hypothetical protein